MGEAQVGCTSVPRDHSRPDDRRRCSLPAPDLSSASVALAVERVPLETFSDAEQEATIGGSGDQIAVQHEPDPAKHSLRASGGPVASISRSDTGDVGQLQRPTAQVDGCQQSGRHPINPFELHSAYPW